MAQQGELEGTRGGGGGGCRSGLSLAVNLPRLVSCSCLLIIRVTGFHGVSRLYMIWLLICSVKVNVHLSTATFHYIIRAVKNAQEN